MWSDPLPILHREVPPPTRSFMPIEPRSYPRQYSHLSGYKAPGEYIPSETHDHWNGKSTFPNFKLFTSSDVEESSKSHDEQEHISRKEDRSLQYQPPHGQIGRGYVNGFGPYDAYPPFPSRQPRKWSDDDLETYFTQMRVNSSSSAPTRGREVPKETEHRHTTSNSTHLIRPVPIRPGDFSRAYNKPSSPANILTPTETDESISGDSLTASSANTFGSITGNVGIHVPEKNKVILERIKRGLDVRTTIMVKNVPNKYTQVCVSLERVG